MCAFCSYFRPVNVCREPGCGIKVCTSGLHPCAFPTQAVTQWTCPNHSGIIAQLSDVCTTNYQYILVLILKSQIRPIAILECVTSKDGPSTLERIQMRQKAMPSTTCSEKLLYKNLELDPKSEKTDKQIQAWAHLHAESNVCPGFIIILFGCFNCQIVEKVRAFIYSIMSYPHINFSRSSNALQ